MFVLVHLGYAQGNDGIQKYLNETATSVKATEDPAQKRAILDRSLHTMSSALEKVERLSLVTSADRAGIDRFNTSLQELRDELAGVNGFERVPDTQLNAFADYSVQSLEQADKTITISLVSALLIVIILILLL
jgi:hypothetical protein